MIDRLPITYIARPMPGHRQKLDIPRNFRRASVKQGVSTTSEYIAKRGYAHERR